MSFAEVLVGAPVEGAPSQKFEIINLGGEEMNFMLLLKKAEADGGNERAGAKKDAKGDAEKSGGGERGVRLG